MLLFYLYLATFMGILGKHSKTPTTQGGRRLHLLTFKN